MKLICIIEIPEDEWPKDPKYQNNILAELHDAVLRALPRKTIRSIEVGAARDVMRVQVERN